MRNISSPKPPLVATATLVFLLTSAIVACHLFNPSFLHLIDLRITDGILERSAPRHAEDAVVIVDIDEDSLSRYGQWPWPRYRLAELLKGVQALGAASIGLDIILAEPDRTSPGTWQATINREMGYRVDLAEIATEPFDHDAMLASTLAGGPFVLGYEFLFGKAEGRRNASATPVHPLNTAFVRRTDGAGIRNRLFEADGAVLNLPRFSQAVQRSGFLNAVPDPDGILRRVPLLIKYGDRVFPAFALATLLRASEQRRLLVRQTGAARQELVLGGRRIPLDGQGNVRISFSRNTPSIPRISAVQILSGRASSETLRNKIVLVGTTAAGLTHHYQAPGGSVFNHLDLQARVTNTLLAGPVVPRSFGGLLLEAAVAIFMMIPYSLSLARFGALVNAGIGLLGVLGTWLFARLLLQSSGLLFSPLLPTLVVTGNYLALTLFMYRHKRSVAQAGEKTALKRLKSSEESLNSVIGTIPDIVFRLDPAGRITFFNSAIERYNGDETLMGRRLLDLVEPADRANATHRLTERRTGSRATVNAELRLRLTLKGSVAEEAFRYFSVSTQGIYRRSDEGTSAFLGTQGIAKDITEHRRLEVQLIQAQKMEAVGSLAAGVAHDLNNVLSVMVGYPELLMMDLPEDSPLREGIADIRQSGLKAAAIVQDLLTLARRNVDTSEVLSLNAVAAEYLASPELAALRERRPKVTIESDFSCELLNIKGSGVHLSKLLMNLAGNAAEAMPAGGRILVRTRNRYLDARMLSYEPIPEGEYVCLSIDDEGVGIPEEDLKKIFEPFFTKKRMGRSGTGLGMSIVWGTVKDHGGYIDIHSREGEGTRFDIYLPATRESVAEKTGRVVLEDYVGEEKILVVDDVFEQREIAQKMLGKLGYRVTSVAGGEEAVDYMETHTVDLIVLDMVMAPGIDGLATFEQIVARHPGQKAIISSGYAESDRVRKLQRLGAGAYVRKPFTLEKIGMAVRRELDRRP